MKVSIVVPVYGVEKYIRNCVLSVKAQTFPDFECLIVNDGTKDNSIAVAREAVGDDERFLFLDKPNGGLSDARNYGLERVKGEYIFFLDSDDTIDPTLLEKTVKQIEKDGSDICCFDLLYVYEDGRREVSAGGKKALSSFAEDKGILFWNNSANNKLYRASFLKDKRFVKGIWYEDLASVPVWMAEAGSISYLAEPLYNYMQRSGSISHSADERIFDLYKSLKIIRDTLGLKAEDMADLYLDNGLIMTTLRIREIEDKAMRQTFFLRNAAELDRAFPNWYEETKKREYSWKQRLVFYLLKTKRAALLNLIY
ncbi:MAG: glycosyltransferase family 2 protein [Erysipelotrichaceae bacterium]|nr:glycosyltransferase family 2 protein [Erysipelotrichaceae bacterium]